MRVCSSVLDDPSTYLIKHCWVWLCALKLKKNVVWTWPSCFLLPLNVFEVLLISNINKYNLQSIYGPHHDKTCLWGGGGGGGVQTK